MNLSAQIRTQLEKLPEGKTFGYADLSITKEDYQAAAKAIQRLQTSGYIKKLSKGVFYKPKQTIFGALKPDYNEQLRTYLYKNGKRIGYETGFSLYNRMGLTTQMSFRIKIASRSNRIAISRDQIKADAVKSYVDITEANFELLGFLDALKDVKRIPDSSISQVVKVLSNKLTQFSETQLVELCEYALFYPPRVRALLGAILENQSGKYNTQKLKNSLNPLSKIKLGLKENELPTVKNWNIE